LDLTVKMQRSFKIGISLVRDDFEKVEEICRRMAIGRSAVIAKAIRFWLEQRKQEELVRCYEEGYRKKPEKVVDLKIFEKAETEVLDPEEEWT